MPHNYNSKRLRDRALFAQWDKRDEGRSRATASVVMR